MIDPKKLLNNFPQTAQRLALKGVSEKEAREARELLRQKNQLIAETEKIRFERNALSKAFSLAVSKRPPQKEPAGKAPPAKPDKGKESKAAEIAALKAKSSRLKALLAEKSKELEKAQGLSSQSLLKLPNLPHEEAPLSGPSVVETDFSREKFFHRAFRPHWETAERLQFLDQKRGAKIAGSMFTVLRGGGARLMRALLNFARALYEKDYIELVVPSLASSAAFTGTGHLPKFAHDAYHVEKDDLWLIPTGEVPLTALHSGEILRERELPLKYMAITPCFRREAGAAGQEGRGIKRLHEFHKLELVKICQPEDSERELQSLLQDALAPIKALGLPYRVLDLPVHDLTFASARTYDIEVYSLGTGEWMEVSSVGLFTDYQTRRLKIRYRPGGSPKGAETGAAGALALPHSLNGSGLAAPRVWAAVLELYEGADGRIKTPEALKDFIKSPYIE